MALILSFVLLGYAVISTVVAVETGKHPRGLYFLFGTEMWERFSYYGMRALLVLYLIEHHGWQPEHSSNVYKWYTSLVYLTPLLGGLLADRYIGLRASIIIGGILMAIGHFLMAFEPLPFFYAALAFLIAGNGFFKPNISTMVGKMYGQDDARRDGGFTIFYMGINVGAGLSPIWCGWLREHYGFDYGFGAAGVGMVFGLMIFLVGQGTVLKSIFKVGNDLKTQREINREKKQLEEQAKAGGKPYRTAIEEQEAAPDDDHKPGETGLSGVFARAFPFVLGGLGILMPAYYIVSFIRGGTPVTGVIMPLAFGVIFIVMGVLLTRIRGAAKDKSIVIFVLFFFVVLFWMAFEQAGNALNLWAEFHTRLSVGSFHYTAESFQSLNPVFILLLAPVFSWLWLWLGKRGKEPRTPVKMFVAMGLMAASFGAMVAGAAAENHSRTAVAYAGALPSTLHAVPTGEAGKSYVEVTEKNDSGVEETKRFDAGRLHLTAGGELEVAGVLPHYVVLDMLAASVADRAWVKKVKKLQDASANATPQQPFELQVPETWKDPFDQGEMEKKGIRYDAPRHMLVFTQKADSPTLPEVIAAAAPPVVRDAVWKLEKESNASRVSAMWLFLSYLLATLGELCLSPVGLSMVTKLAPRRFASLFMGVWLLSSSVAQYAGGSIGESWGIIPPTSYFTLFVWTSLVGMVVLGVLLYPLRRLMHEVH